MEGILGMFKRFIVGGGEVVSMKPYKKTTECPYYVEIDEKAWDEFRGQNVGATLNDFIATYGVKKMLCAGQDIPDGFIGVQAGAAIKLRL